MAHSAKDALSPPDALGKTVANELNINRFNLTSTSISGTSTNIHNSFKELEADLKSDLAGLKEYEGLQRKSKIRREEIQKRVAANRAWVEQFDKGDNTAEVQYRRLLEDIEVIYNGAKEFHEKGIDMLIEEFRYHVAYKRWNDTFSSIPFKPK